MMKDYTSSASSVNKNEEKNKVINKGYIFST